MKQISAVVPTLGLSRWLVPCLDALRRDGGRRLQIILVDQGKEPVELPAGLVDDHLHRRHSLGFAAATNLGITAAGAPFIALVNDDVVVESGWSASLLRALEAHPRAAAAQGILYQLAEPTRVDGCGLAFNRWWQAVQLGNGEAVESWQGGPPLANVFGVSATAALYRRAALEAVAFGPGKVFDERLGSYYEDVDLACRLRAAGFGALRVREARAGHAGSATGLARPLRRQAQIYGNRYLVNARWMGRSFWGKLPRMLLRDLGDAARLAAAGRFGSVAGILAGGCRALLRLPRFAHAGPPRPALAAARRGEATT